MVYLHLCVFDLVCSYSYLMQFDNQLFLFSEGIFRVCLYFYMSGLHCVMYFLAFFILKSGY